MTATLRWWGALPVNDERAWTVSVWDGHSTRQFQRHGTYEQAAATCAHYPPAYIWSIT